MSRRTLLFWKSVLNNPDYRLIKAQSADQALLALLVDQFALLILDIRMPGVTGIELAHMIKERKKTALIPIIFLTAYYNEDQHVLEGYGAGAVDYLHKPVNPDILRSKVAVFAELYRMQREIKASNHALLAEVTERRQAQQQLRELNDTLEQRVMERTRALRTSAAMLQAATDNASVGLATLDNNLRLHIRQSGILQNFPPANDVVGKQPAEILAPENASMVSSLLDRALAGERNSCELDRPGDDGRQTIPLFCGLRAGTGRRRYCRRRHGRVRHHRSQTLGGAYPLAVERGQSPLEEHAQRRIGDRATDQGPQPRGVRTSVSRIAFRPSRPATIFSPGASGTAFSYPSFYVRNSPILEDLIGRRIVLDGPPGAVGCGSAMHRHGHS